MINAPDLPDPSAEELAVSAELGDRIRQAIDNSSGHIGFDEYMRMALYEPGFGYYVGGAEKFGAGGDFITAPEVSPLFGRCIARQCREILARTGGSVVEFGAGSGVLAASVLNALGASGSLPERYAIFELSPELRERQGRTIERLAGAFADTVEWIDRPPEAPLDGVVLANEILDSFPVKIFKSIAGRVYERRVALDGRRFRWMDIPADPVLDDRVRGLVAPEIVEQDTEYISEINIGTEPWISDLAVAMNNAVALIVDYGFPRAEYYHPQRTSGTLICHFRHSTHNDPFWCPGIQDITASVDFTWVAEAASACSLQVLGFAEQASFLLSNGLLDDAQQRGSSSDEVERQRVAYETKMLTLPTEMGSRFKVMALGKGYNFPLQGFQLRDDRHRL